jgi:hypothetical protein
MSPGGVPWLPGQLLGRALAGPIGCPRKRFCRPQRLFSLSLTVIVPAARNASPWSKCWRENEGLRPAPWPLDQCRRRAMTPLALFLVQPGRRSKRQRHQPANRSRPLAPTGYHCSAFVHLRAEGDGSVRSAKDTHSHCAASKDADGARSDGLIAAACDEFCTWYYPSGQLGIRHGRRPHAAIKQSLNACLPTARGRRRCYGGLADFRIWPKAENRCVAIFRPVIGVLWRRQCSSAAVRCFHLTARGSCHAASTESGRGRDRRPASYKG